MNGEQSRALMTAKTVLVGMVAFGMGAAMKLLVPTEHSLAGASISTTPGSSRPGAVSPKSQPLVARPTINEVLSSSGPSLFHVLARYLIGAPVEDIVALASAWEHTVDETAPLEAWQFVMAAWVRHDPHAALKQASTIEFGDPHRENRYIRSSLVASTYRYWIETDMHAAIAAAERDPDEPMRFLFGDIAQRDLAFALALLDRKPELMRFAEPVLAELAKSDPPLALQRAEAISDGTIPISLLGGILRNWATVEPDAAFDYLGKLEHSERVKAPLARDMLNRLVRHDATQAEPYVRRLPPGSQRHELTMILATTKAKTDPKAALEWAKTLTDELDRQAATAIAIHKLSESSPLQMLDYVDQLPWSDFLSNPASSRYSYRMNGSSGSGSPHSSVADGLSELLPSLAETDPRKALTIAAKLPDVDCQWNGNLRTNTTKRILNAVFKRSPETFLELAAEIPVSVIIDLKYSLVSGASQDGLDWLAANWERLPGGELQKPIATALGRKLAEIDPLKALDFAATLEEKMQPSIVMAAASNLAKSDPELAMETFGALPDDFSRERVARSILEELAETDPDMALAWFDSLEESDQSTSAVKKVTNIRYQLDPNAASKWVAGLPPGQQRDTAAARLTESIVRDEIPDFDAALQWANQVEEQNQRHSTLSIIYRHWLPHNFDAAKASLDASTLPDKWKKNLVDRVR